MIICGRKTTPQKSVRNKKQKNNVGFPSDIKTSIENNNMNNFYEYVPVPQGSK